MSNLASSKKRQSTSMNTSATSPHPSEHSRKRIKTNDETNSIPLRNSKFPQPNKPSPSIPNGKIIHAQPIRAAKDASTSHLDESRTSVIAATNQPENDSKKVIEISSDEENGSDLSDDDEDDEDEDEDEDDRDNTGDDQDGVETQAVLGTLKDTPFQGPPYSSTEIPTNGVNGSHLLSDVESDNQATEQEQNEDQDMADGEEDISEEPTFGELLRAHEPDEIDVDAAFDTPDSPSHSKAVLLAQSTSQRDLSIPSGTSLTMVLTQALRTNDNELLESCFRMDDGDSIRSTIDNLPSTLVSQLLQRIAERLYKRPGRAGNLMIWVQWSIVAHGGFLASQPAVAKQLASLNRVLRERAASLQPLLTLKGKLDMLNAQLELRRSKQAAAREAESEEEDDEPVIYVEGEDDDFGEEGKEEEEDDDEEEADATTKSRKQKARRHKKKPGLKDIEFEDSGDEDETMVNGVDADEEDEDSGNDDLDEADDTDANTDDELENADIDEDESESSSSEDEEVPSPGR